MIVEWPHRYLQAEVDAGRIDERTVLCVLTHDPKFDVPLLEVALRIPVAYVGAMGSRRTHDERLARLAEAGLTKEEIGRLSSPIGLDLGARTPEETAVSIAAEIIAGRWGGTGERLAGIDGPDPRDRRPLTTAGPAPAGGAGYSGVVDTVSGMPSAAPDALPGPGGPVRASARADRGAGPRPPRERTQPDRDRRAHGHVAVGRRPAGERRARRAAVHAGALRGGAGPHAWTGRSDRPRSPHEHPIGRAGTWPPLPPEPPEPPLPPARPWLPEPRPAAPAGSASASLSIGARDWLAERLLDQRVVALAGELDDETANRTVAALGTARRRRGRAGRLRLSGVRRRPRRRPALVDALDLMGAPVHATCLGTLTGPAVALLAVADRRIAGPHAILQLQRATVAGRHSRPGDGGAWPPNRPLAERLQERLAEACRRRRRDRSGHARRRLLTAQRGRTGRPGGGLRVSAAWSTTAEAAAASAGGALTDRRAAGRVPEAPGRPATQTRSLSP